MKLFYLNLVSVLIVLSILVILSIISHPGEEFVEVYWQGIPEKVDGNYTLNFRVKSYFNRRLVFNASILVDGNLKKMYKFSLDPKQGILLSEHLNVPENSTEIKVVVSPSIGKSSYINYWITNSSVNN
jgi:hypothetical protein